VGVAQKMMIVIVGGTRNVEAYIIRKRDLEITELDKTSATNPIVPNLIILAKLYPL
jgi:hypothetical protein